MAAKKEKAAAEAAAAKKAAAEAAAKKVAEEAALREVLGSLALTSPHLPIPPHTSPYLSLSHPPIFIVHSHRVSRLAPSPSLTYATHPYVSQAEEAARQEEEAAKEEKAAAEAAAANKKATAEAAAKKKQAAAEAAAAKKQAAAAERAKVAADEVAEAELRSERKRSVMADATASSSRADEVRQQAERNLRAAEQKLEAGKGSERSAASNKRVPSAAMSAAKALASSETGVPDPFDFSAVDEFELEGARYPPHEIATTSRHGSPLLDGKTRRCGCGRRGSKSTAVAEPTTRAGG